MKNLAIIVAGCLIYILGAAWAGVDSVTFLVVVPSFVGVAAYCLMKTSPIKKRFAISAIPLLALPVLAFIDELRVAITIALLHCVYIGVLLLQVWESVVGIFAYRQKSKF